MTEPRSGPQAPVVDQADQPGSSDHSQPSSRADVNAQTCLTVPFSALRPVPETGRGSDYAEPWSSPLDAYETVVDRFGETVVDMLGSDMPKRFEADYARRIAACVNFCHQIPTDVLEVIGGARFPVKAPVAASNVTAIDDFTDGGAA